MKLKVCGITTLGQLQQLQEMEVDYAGLIFYEGSKRYAHEKLKSAASEIKKLKIKKVGVFVNAGMGFLKSLIPEYGLDAVQLHGDEPAAYCSEIRKEAVVIKAFRMGKTTAVDELVAPYESSCDYFLFDTDSAGYGGSGKRFDWTILQEAAINKPFFLSGGIGPESMGFLKSFAHPFLYAVDVNSRFETAPGIKDMSLLKSFHNAFKQHAHE